MSRPPKPVRYEKKPMYPVARGRAPEVVEPARGAGPRPVAESSEGGGSDYAISAAQRDARHRPPRTCSAHWFHLSAVFLPCPEFLAREERSSCSRPGARMSWDSGSTPPVSAPPPVPARALPRCSRRAASWSFFSRASSNWSRWLWSMALGCPPGRARNGSGQEVGDEVEQRRDGQADDVEVIPVDLLDERGAAALDRVAPGPLTPLARGEVALEQARIVRAEGHLGGGEARTHVLPLPQAEPRDHE